MCYAWRLRALAGAAPGLMAALGAFLEAHSTSPGGVLVTRQRTGRLLSIVVPMHNEGCALDPLFKRLDAVLAGLGVEAEIVCVDDGSRDDTLVRLLHRAGGDARLKVIALARNFGKEAALTAGIDAARGAMVVPIDADLQDPPELIGEFIRLWEQGYEVVYGVRTDRGADSLLKRLTASLFYRAFNQVSDLRIPTSAGDFRLMDRKVIEALKQFPERNRFMKGLFAWVGFAQIGVPYARPARSAGASSWSYYHLWRFALDGITSFSTAPLRIWTGCGLALSAAALIAAVALVVVTLLNGRQVPGYASLMVVILFGLAVQLIAFGILGEYVGRLYQEVKGRPIYIVSQRAGFDD